ncbi:MAG TPA: SAM-dependent methyltransferase, partial [Caulobacteraceae bacterium]
RLADPTRDLVDAVFCGIAIGLSADPVRIASSWTVAARPLEDFFDRLERALARPGLSRRALQGLRLRMMNEAVASRASTRTVPVDLRRFRAIEAGPGVDTLKLDFHLGGDERAGVQLPVWGGLSARDVARAAVNTVSLRRLIGRSGIARRPGFWAAVGAETLRAAALLARAARPGSLSRKSRLKATLAAILKNAIVRSAPPSSRPDVLEAARARLGDLSGGTVEMPPAGAPNTSARLDALDPTRDPKAYFEELFREEDPWNYTNRYESLKYEQTLALLPDQPFDNAMEVACAEGHFTRMLAPKVERLLAVDISRKALERAVARCAGLDHVSFKPFDLVSDPFPTGLDLLVCSEVLYYLGDEKRLAAVAQRMAAALAPGGVLISAHAFQLSDDATRTGFDWGDAYGGETISRLFQATPGLRLERSVLTDLYAINLFRRDDRAGPPPIIEHRAHASPLDEDVERHVVWGGAAVTRARAARTERAFEAPVLMYHRIAESGPDALADYRVTPADFQAQMRLLRRHGYHAVTSRDLVDRFARGKPFHGRPVLITFDDGYQDFADHAWPVLKRNDFTAEVFLVTEKVGGRADWDGDHGAAAPLMDWETIRALAREGVNFGSHLATHRAVDTLNSQDLFDEAALSRLTLKAQLGTEVRSVAAPFGIYDDRLPYILSLCGYEAGFTTQEGRASMLHRPLHLPRIEVVGGASLDDFAKSIGLDAPMTATDAV